MFLLLQQERDVVCVNQQLLDEYFHRQEPKTL